MATKPTHNLSHGQAVTILRRLGWRITTAAQARAALKLYQRGYALGAALKADGVLGPKTSAALLKSEARRRAGQPTASAHFGFDEWRCKCGGRYGSCARIKVERGLLLSLERYRARVGHNVQIVSGYRCPSHNRAVGGATHSQHVDGTAADIGYALSTQTVANLRAFAGIGYSRRTHLVRHVDRRDLNARNNNGGKVRRPVLWPYAS